MTERQKAEFTEQRLPVVLQEQHPVHGQFGLAYEELGGLDRLIEWAQTSDGNYAQFLRLFAKMTPINEAGPNQINIQVNALLGRSPLDG